VRSAEKTHPLTVACFEMTSCERAVSFDVSISTSSAGTEPVDEAAARGSLIVSAIMGVFRGIPFRFMIQRLPPVLLVGVYVPVVGF